MKGSEHHDHEYALLHKAFERRREGIAASLAPLEKQVATCREVLTQLNNQCGEISDHRGAIKDNLHATFRRLREVLCLRETELVNQLDQMTQAKIKGLTAQRDQIETTLAQLDSCLHFMRESLRTDNEKYLLRMKMSTLTELTASFNPDALKPHTSADIAFSAPPDMTAVCQAYGLLFTPAALPDPMKCRITDKAVQEAVLAVGKKQSAVLQAISFEGKRCEVPITLECEFTSELTGARAGCKVKGRAHGEYKISYCPTVKGCHQLGIKVEGHHIRGSPFSMAVTSPSVELTTPALSIGGIEKPWGVAITRSGEIVVSDFARHCVCVFGPSGKKLRTFGSRGTGLGRFNEPRGVTVDGEGNILVADCRNHRIQKFTAEGQFLALVGTFGRGVLEFTDPSRVEYNQVSNKLYVSDGNRVQFLNSDLTFCGTIEEVGTGPGQFHEDYILGGLACDSTGNVYVTDFGNARIQVFTPAGEFLRMFGGHGRGFGELYCPVGVAVDSNDMVYVSENGSNRVSVFTSTGQYVTCGGDLNRPRGLTADQYGLVYVCDAGNSRLQIF
jgi:tripartite motif-containing protein 2/3/tripartite motif-containing protein 71